MADQAMRVAVLTHGYYPRLGGIERQRAAVTPLLRRRGIDPFVVTRWMPGTAFTETRHGVRVVRTPALGERSWPRPLRRVARAIDAAAYSAIGLVVLLRRRPDVIHAHEFLSTIRLGLLAGRLLRVPVIATAHLSGPTGDVGRMSGSLRRRRLLRRIQRRGALTIAVSSAIDEELASAGFPAERRVVVANGVDVQRFRPPSPGEREELRARLGVDGDPLVVFTGRLEPQKRLDVLLAAWTDVCRRVPSARLLVLGEGSLAPSLQGSADPTVRFLGAVDDVAPHLRACDVFVLPSDAEGLSNALIEAQASGLPAVATDVGGADDVIVPGRTGLLVPPGDAVGLAEAITALAEDPRLRSRMSRAARERVVSTFSLERTVDAFLRSYLSVTSEAPCPPR